MKIKIDENYHLETDNFNGCVLVFEQIRQKEKLDKERNKTGIMEEYTFTDRWFYPNPKLAMLKYIELTSKEIDFSDLTNSFLMISEKLDKLYNSFKEVNFKLK